jgi:hypothetical protein
MPPPYQPPRTYAPDYRPAPPPAYPDQMAPRRTWQEAPVDVRAPAPLPVGEEEDVGRGPPPRAPMPAQRGREEEYAEEDLDDVFDEAETRRPRRDRARAEDYSAAYRSYEDDYEEEEPRRRSGPLILLLSLVAVALIAAALIVWYKKDGLITTGDRGNVPVITAPQEPVKTQPQPSEQQEQATQQTSDQLQVQPVRRKQIYDRILGEETLEPERIVPTEEQPQLPTQNQDATGQQQGTGQQPGTEPLPLPLPPPPTNNGQQGSLEPPQSTGKTVLDQAANPDQEVVAEPASNTGTLSEGKSDSEQVASDLQIPVPEVPANQTVAERGNIPVEQPSEQQQGEQIIDTNQQPKATQQPQQTEVVEEPQLPKQQEEVVTPPQQKAAVEQPVDDGRGPIQLSPLAPQGTQLPQPVQQPQQVLAPPQTDQVARKPARPGGREDDPLEGQRVPFTGNATQQAQGTQQLNTVSDLALQPVVQPQPQQQQVASIEQPQQQQVATIEQPQPQSQSAAVGYVVQLASFRTEAEAQNEYQRLVQRHASLLSGLTPRIQKSDLGASGTFFRLSVGALPSSAAATKLCNSLIAAGEKDCLVRRL